MRTSNPALREKSFEHSGPISDNRAVMTVNGTINKAFILTFLVVLSASWTWEMTYNSLTPEAANIWMMIGLIGGFIVALITIFMKKFAPITAPIYAALEGLFIGGISAMLEASFPGIVLQAVGLTFGILFFMLFLYRTGIIKPTKKFTFCIVAATGSICLVYLATILLSFFGISIPYIHGSGPIGIGFSLFVVVIASLNFILDFDLIQYGADQRAPKYMEWYAAFGLMVTLIWLYIEILRLLSKLRSR